MRYRHFYTWSDFRTCLYCVSYIAHGEYKCYTLFLPLTFYLLHHYIKDRYQKRANCVQYLPFVPRLSQRPPVTFHDCRRRSLFRTPNLGSCTCNKERIYNLPSHHYSSSLLLYQKYLTIILKRDWMLLMVQTICSQKNHIRQPDVLSLLPVSNTAYDIFSKSPEFPQDGGTCFLLKYHTEALNVLIFLSWV